VPTKIFLTFLQAILAVLVVLVSVLVARLVCVLTSATPEVNAKQVSSIRWTLIA
jgi:hypothetical protein